MFNPALFSKEDIATLSAICTQPLDDRQGRRLREGTKDEWRVISGIAEGSIVCRRMPDLLRSVLDAKERLRLYTTIQKQVEGELVIQLRSWAEIKENRQQTRTIKDDILLAATAVGARVNLADLQLMLNLAKTISYDYVRRRIHIFFFDRATAKKFQDTLVAFKGVVYKPVNMHRQDTGSVWERQLGRDGVRLAAQREYEITIYNVTRFTDIGRLSAYLQIHLAGDFELEDMDDCTPNSLTSTVWKLKIKSAECPEYLRGIVRIVWFGRTLVLKHPYAKQRLQCLKCGNLGHTMARCRYTDELLRGAGSRVAEDQEIVGLEDLAQPFSSLAEVKLSAAKRLQLQAEAESRAHEAVLPAESGHQRAQEVRTPAQGMTTAEGHEPRTVKSDHHEVAPEPKQKWIAMPLPRGRTLYAHPATLKQNGIRISSRYAELVEEDEEDNAGESKLEEKPPAQPVIDVSSGDEQPEVPRPKISAAAKAKLHLVRAKPPKLQETPQLVALKQRERNSIAETVASLSSQKGKMLTVQTTPAQDLITFPDIEQALGLRQVATPSTGNCMAMARAQATADHNLAAFDENLEKITAAIKRGIHWTGQLNYSEQFDHFTRTTTLVNVNRGWEGMTPQESNKQFKWYLAEYASTPSSRKETVERHNWGCSELMSIAANFLQTKIFVLAYNTDAKHQWSRYSYIAV
ncbi:hypothetical protein PF001_g27749 [Phytophthora fragariae]|uniref:Uncharacterized protein n=1 Tax=Phytophthora fragariae TaxID=53985 RepID=A0A6A4BIB8_9STRA|nr:hypothetical protein PF001_g27749 [Phytophthora fragariae]